MSTKLLSIIVGMILLIGIINLGVVAAVSAKIDRITNVTPVDLGNINIIAGDTGTTSFSFDFPNVQGNYNNAPLVARVNFTSLNLEYPVWKGDFQLFMSADQFLLPGFYHYNTIPMTCSENAPINFKAKDKPLIQYSLYDVPNGTFYCYNPNYYIMQLDSNDKINISITPNIALYPGNYSMTIELLEMEPDTNGPVIQLVSPADNQIFSENNNIIPIKLNITDMYNIDSSSVKYKIVTYGAPSDGVGLNATYYDSGWIYDATYNPVSKLYEAEFNMQEHNLNFSGSYWIYAEAKDVIGNNGKL